MNENAKNTYIQVIYNDDKIVTKEQLLNELIGKKTNISNEPNKRIHI